MKLPLWRRRQDQDLTDELHDHFRMAIRDRVERGESPAAAEAAARREFGSLALVQETTREMWGWIWVEQLGQDMRYAFRTFRQAPGFAAVAIVTLALGIGANTAMFSVVHAVLLKPLPFPDADRLVSIGEVDLRRGGRPSSVSWPDFFDFRARTQTLAGLSAYHDASFTLIGTGPSQHLPGAVVSADFFGTLGVPPAVGRDFRPAEEHPGSNVVVVSDAFWHSQMGGRRDVVGHHINLNGRSFTVIGVMPARFHFPLSFPAPQLWVTSAQDAHVDNAGDSPVTEERGAHFLKTVGRRKPGIHEAAVQAEFDVIARALAKEYPQADEGRGVSIEPELEALVGTAKQPLLVLLAAVGCVLLIACVNLANLLLARGAGRHRELSLRAALGASRRRIGRQLLTESFVLSTLGAGLGLAVAAWSLPLLVRLSPANLRGLDEVAIGTSVLAFTGVVAIGCAILFGTAPALSAARRDLAAAIHDVRATTGQPQRRLLNGLVVVETALGVALLVTAALLLRSFIKLAHTNPGFDPSHVVTLTVDLPDTRYPYLKQVAFFDGLLADLARLPGVQASGLVAPLPLSGTRYGISFELPGQPWTPGAERLSATFVYASPGYFRAMRIPIVRGREFRESDTDAAPRVVVINESFAAQYFPHEDPIGKRIKPGLSTTEKETPWREIVGVAADIKVQALSEAARPGYVVPYSQGLITMPNVLIRTTAGAPDALVESVRKVVAARDPELAVHDVSSMDEYVAASMASPRFAAWLLGLFAALGLLLTAIGLYGVLAYGVAQRTHEFGIRFALGATSSNVVGMVVRGAVGLTGAGLVLGIGAAALGARFVAHALDFVDPADAPAFVAVVGILVGVGALAAYVPARRAAHVDPVYTLRSE